MTTPLSNRTFPSAITPPQAGFAPRGPVVDDPRPPVDASAKRLYFLRFDIVKQGDDVTNDHLLDRNIGFDAVSHNSRSAGTQLH